MPSGGHQPAGQDHSGSGDVGTIAPDATRAATAMNRAGVQGASTSLFGLCDITAKMAQSTSPIGTLRQILHQAAELTGAGWAGLYVSANQLNPIIATQESGLEVVDCQIGLGPKSRLITGGPLAEHILTRRTEPYPVIIDGQTAVVIPVANSGLVIFGQPPTAAITGELEAVLRVLANLACGVVVSGSELSEATSRADTLERIRKRLLSKNMKLRERSMIDDLTGLYNRRFFQRSLSYELDRFLRYRHSLGVVLFDVDHFKRINDTYGHSTGDDALKHLANVAQSGIRSTDLLARYGGEEFVVLLPDTDMDGTLTTAERLRLDLCSTPFTVKDEHIKITISAGATALDHRFDGDADQVMGSVDEALYEAKAGGRNQVVAVRI